LAREFQTDKKTIPMTPSTPNHKVLIVEDEEIVRNVVSRRLTRSGFQVVEASTAAEARIRAAENIDTLSVILCDVVLPDGNGRELVESIQRDGARIPVLFMSGYPEEIVTERKLIWPGAAFIEKTLVTSGIVDKVQDVIRESSHA
jgi:two-component system cell cycle sensor histidine kinase/response regulator CckA